MIHKYDIIGATCNNCIDSIQKALIKIPEVKSAVGTLNPPEIIIELNSHIKIEELNKVLKQNTKYQLSNEEMIMDININKDTKIIPLTAEITSAKFSDYIPLFVIFGYILGGSILLSFITKSTSIIDSSMPGMSMMKASTSFSLMPWMNYFMGIWFIVFSLFKFLDLKGFADGYFTYDLIAKKWSGWGYIYPFVELALGVSYLLGTYLFATNLITLILMVIGVIGVSIKLAKKSKIQCLCLGTILKVPLTQITLYENSLMAIMATLMLFM